MSATQILVVEDERLVATAIQNELEQFGYQVSGIASSAGEAVEKAIECKPDLVLMDIHLKGEIDGIDAARKIHSYCGVPIVYLSAFSDPETVARASGISAYGYLLKPYEERELQTTIEMAVAKRRAEQKLEETQRWLSAIHNSIQDGVVAIDSHHYIQFMNPTADALTGWKNQAAGQPISSVCKFAADNQPLELGKLIDTVVRENRTQELPLGTTMNSRDGRSTPVEGAFSPIFDSRSNLLGTVLVVRDISPRLKLELLERQNEHRMRQAQKFEAVSRVAGGLSQNLSHLLTAILGDTSLALTSLPEDAESHELLERVEAASQRAAQLVQRLHVFSLTALRPDRQLHSVDLGRLVSSCLNEISGRFQSRFTFTHCPHLWRIAADEPLLGQAILELLFNAREVRPAGERVNVNVDNVEMTESDLAGNPQRRPGPFVRLRFGNDDSSTEKLAPATSKEFSTNQPGGLGMALVTAVVESHHGWVESQNRAGGAPRVDLYLPKA
jgi:two-component system, cell cycle sensor histidine kinase and response regulator CckA